VEGTIPSQSTSFGGQSVYTLRCKPDSPNRLFEIETPPVAYQANDTAFDVAVVQFRDDGTWLDAAQIDAAESWIRASRSALAQGVMVVVFIHGWHHNASWNRTPVIDATQPDGDEHFHAFRLILESLTLREAERYASDGAPAGRRVIGIYLAWNGDPEDSWVSGVSVLTHATFWNRYKVAEQIGAHSQFEETVRRLVDVSKADGPDSPLIFLGHSMGALMLQSAFATLLESSQYDLVQQPSRTGGSATAIRSHGALVSFPELVLSLNSAADSAIALRIVNALGRRAMTKTAAGGTVSYSPPLVASVTSAGDSDTGFKWSAAKLGRVTDGHDPSLMTHNFVLTAKPDSVQCRPRVGLDFGQNWHCVRMPHPHSVATPAIPIDLPTRERNDLSDNDVPHARYTISPIDTANRAQPHAVWVFQVPPEIIKDHNDIFNSKARSLVLGLIQISGAVASLAENWQDTFEA
jgi:hypothetical protein